MDEHVLQLQRNYCVPACIVMLEIWRGRAPTDVSARQHELFERYQINGLCGLQSLDPEYGRWLPWFDIREPDSVVNMAAHLGPDHRVLVNLVPGSRDESSDRMYGAVLRRRGIESPHGPLPEDYPHPYHAVCVTRRVGRTLHVLDPWVPREHQPIALGYDEFAACWTGDALSCAR